MLHMTQPAHGTLDYQHGGIQRETESTSNEMAVQSADKDGGYTVQSKMSPLGTANGQAPRSTSETA